MAPRVLLVGGTLELLATLRSVLGSVDVYVACVDPAVDEGGLERAVNSAAVVVLADARAEERLAGLVEQVRADQTVVRISPASNTVRPSALAVEAWFSTPPRAEEVVDFVQRFYSG